MKVVSPRGLSFPDDPVLLEYVKLQYLGPVLFIGQVSRSVEEYGRTRYRMDTPAFGN